MPNRPNRAPFLLILAATVALGVAGSPSSRAAADGFVVICNAKASTSALSRAELKALYTGKSKTLGGSAVVVVTRPEGDVPFGQFVDQIFGIAIKTLLAKIHQEVFKGEMTKPSQAVSDEQVVQSVGASPGMIGVVSPQGAIHLPSSVVVVRVGG